MGQACSSQVCVASEAPKHVDESCKTPRDLKEKPLQDVAHVHVQATATAAAPQAVPPSAHEVPPSALPAAAQTAAAPAPSAEENRTKAETPTAQHGDTTHPAAETKPYVDAASLLKPVQEVSLAPLEDAAEQTTDPADQKISHCLADPEPPQHAPDLGQHSLQDSHTHSTDEAQHAAHADLQDSTHQEEQPQHKTDDAADSSEHQPAPEGQDLELHQGQDEEAGDGGDRSRKTTADAIATQHSIKSNSSVSQELSGLTVAATPDALVDEVSQSVLKAPTAAPSNMASRAASGSLHAEHSNASDGAKNHEERANTDNHHSSELHKQHSSTKEHHEHANIPNEHSSELHKEHSITQEHHEHANIPNELSSDLPKEHSSATEQDEQAKMQEEHSAELPKEHSAEAQHDNSGDHEHGDPFEE